ncbi:hypothetical protein H8959_015804 [Pygathrix nigripes]
MTPPPPPQASRTVKGKGNRKLNAVLQSSSADGARAPAANLARRCQPQSWQTTGRREEELLAGQADPPPPGIELKTPPHACPTPMTTSASLSLGPLPGPQTLRLLLLPSPHLPAPRHLPP